MIKKRYLVALGAVSAALAACGSDLQGPPAGSGAASGSAGSTTATGGSTSTGGTTGSGGSTAHTGGTSTTGGTTGTGGTSGTTGGTSGTGGSSGTSGAAGDTSNITCAPGIPASTEIPRMLNRQYDAVVNDLLGIKTLASGGGKRPSDLLNADFDGAMFSDAWQFYQDTAAKIAAEVISGPNKSKFISCDASQMQCLTDTIKAFGRKAFRRALTQAEVTSFMRLASLTPAGTADQIAQAVLTAFLVSPSFILIPELTDGADGAPIALSSQEVAARLSFMLWDSIPDDTLNAAADAGQLTTKEQILAQATRMVALRDKTGPVVSAFHQMWVVNNGTSHWWKMDHDTSKYPAYPADATAAKTSFQAELDAFFADVAYSGGSFKDLFLSNVGFVNHDNAAIYGLDPAAYGADLKRVELDANQRPGFLTRAGFLSSFSHYDATSPILRGAFVTVNMIGVNPGSPAADASQFQAPEADYKTEREYVVALTSQRADCKGCHIPLVNPPGFVLEHYDSIGKWQDTDPRGGPIDGTATVTFAPGVTKDISSPLQLMQEIAATPKAKSMYAQKWVSYATGRQPNANDQCMADQLDLNLAMDGYTVLNLLSDLTQADSFRLRVRETP